MERGYFWGLSSILVSLCSVLFLDPPLFSLSRVWEFREVSYASDVTPHVLTPDEARHGLQRVSC